MGSYSIFITSGIVWVVLYVVFHMSMQKMGCFNARRGEIIPFLVCICISRHSLRTDLFSWVGGYGRALIIGSYSISITSGNVWVAF